MTRHVLGLYHGQSGGRRFRQILSDAALLRDGDAGLLLDALAAVEGTDEPTPRPRPGGRALAGPR